jgi:hypothetical protein
MIVGSTRPESSPWCEGGIPKEDNQVSAPPGQSLLSSVELAEPAEMGDPKKMSGALVPWTRDLDEPKQWTLRKRNKEQHFWRRQARQVPRNGAMWNRWSRWSHNSTPNWLEVHRAEFRAPWTGTTGQASQKKETGVFSTRANRSKNSLSFGRGCFTRLAIVPHRLLFSFTLALVGGSSISRQRIKGPIIMIYRVIGTQS